MAIFSERYAQSPLLRLDNTVVNEDGIVNQAIGDSILKACVHYFYQIFISHQMIALQKL